MPADSAQLEVAVACGLPDRQQIIAISVAPGTTARAAVEMSGIAAVFPELAVADCPLAIFGQPIDDARLLQSGDRVEICRPLRIDPRDARRRAAMAGGTLGGGKPPVG
jgi:putative ubiquitin-RnfH superfamily antitoxin RatB of RatAB toxin-antitoxin module